MPASSLAERGVPLLKGSLSRAEIGSYVAVLDLLRMLLEMRQRPLDCARQVTERREVPIMCVLPFDSAPQVLDRIVVRRVSRQLLDPQPLRMLGKDLSRLGRCVIACPILDQENRLLGLLQYSLDERAVALGIEAPLMTMPEQASREILDQAEDLVAFALPSRLDERLLPAHSPGVAQGAPLCKAGFVPKEQQRSRAPREGDKRWPGFPQPRFTSLRWSETKRAF